MAQVTEDRSAAHRWLDRWDVQQAGYIPEREARAEVMLDAVEELCGGDELTILDLACGPGSLTGRLLRRFPRARIIGVDLDPVLLGLAREALGDGDGRITWVEGDLRSADWVSRLGVEQVDAVVSTTALHWLVTGDLVATFGRLHDLLRPGGVFLNGDHMAYDATLPTIRALSERMKSRRQDRAFGEQGVEDYAAWHEALAADRPDLPWEEKQRRFGDRQHDVPRPGHRVHEAALRDVGFAEVTTVWQVWDNRVVLAVRGEDIAPIAPY